MQVKYDNKLQCYVSNFGGFYTQTMLDKAAAKGKAFDIVEEFDIDYHLEALAQEELNRKEDKT